LAAALLVVGLVPWIGLAWIGSWSETELALGLLLCFAAGWAAWLEWNPRR